MDKMFIIGLIIAISGIICSRILTWAERRYNKKSVLYKVIFRR